MADGEIYIEWYCVPNEHKASGGFMPVIAVDTGGARGPRQRGSTYGKGYDRETALLLARGEAYEEAARYFGDYDVVVEERRGSPGKHPKQTARDTAHVGEKAAAERGKKARAGRGLRPRVGGRGDI